MQLTMIVNVSLRPGLSDTVTLNVQSSDMTETSPLA